LDVVINGEDWLCRISNRCRADLFEFRNHRAGVVMRHHMARANRNEIAAAHYSSGGEPVSVSRGNLLNERKTHGRLLSEIDSATVAPLSIFF
jgi:hypothetical protein